MKNFGIVDKNQGTKEEKEKKKENRKQQERKKRKYKVQGKGSTRSREREAQGAGKGKHKVQGKGSTRSREREAQGAGKGKHKVQGKEMGGRGKKGGKNCRAGKEGGKKKKKSGGAGTATFRKDDTGKGHKGACLRLCMHIHTSIYARTIITYARLKKNAGHAQNRTRETGRNGDCDGRKRHHDPAHSRKRSRGKEDAWPEMPRNMTDKNKAHGRENEKDRRDNTKKTGK